MAFLGDGKQISVRYRAQDSQCRYVLYGTATGRDVDAAEEPDQPNGLPQWAKTRTQIEDESVAQSAELTQQRTAWIAKLMRQLKTIHPGLKRKDLDSFLTTEGGLSTRFERTYVLKECLLIKLNIRFKQRNRDTDAITEKPDDVVESVSEPYLAPSIYD